MENKKTKIISIVAMVALALTVVTATYAYFQAQTGEGSQTDIKINANTADTFTFETGSAMSLSLDQTSFASGAGNITGSTYASALLTANNKTNTATEHYYLYLKIENNTFTYSINESTPEIIMTVTDSGGNEVTNISTLNHVIVTGANGAQVSGYDITNKNGLITLLNNREITTTSSKEEKWNIKVTFVNYDASQNANAAKSMSAKVMIQKEKINLLADYVKSLYTGIQGENSIYYHNGTIKTDDGTVIDAGDNSYRYAGANPNNYVCFGSNVSTCPTDNLYRIIGVFGNNVKLIKYDYANSNLLGRNGDYSTSGTYSKSSYSSYKGKLATINRYYWNKSTQKNTWSTSLFNKTNLNANFITNIGSEWAKKIATTTWKVGGNTSANIATSAMYIAYQNEVVHPETTYTTDNAKEYTAKIGLMYVSDYGYAASPTYWTYVGYNSSDSTTDYRAATSTNWMYMGLPEWTISRLADYTFYVFYVTDTGYVDREGVNYSRAVRPSFSLLSSITYAGGSGTQSDPIIIG